MGYFSNGTEGDSFRARYCDRCVHGAGGDLCPIWALHLDYNYDQHDQGAVIATRDGAFTEPLSALLARFIRREKETPGGWTGQECTMFRPVSEEARLEMVGQLRIFGR